MAIAGEIGQQQMIVEMQQPEMSPVAGVKFLALIDRRRSDLTRVGREFADVGNALFLVDDQVVDDIEIFGARLRRESLEVLAISAAVVHVHVQVGTREDAELLGKAAGAEA